MVTATKSRKQSPQVDAKANVGELCAKYADDILSFDMSLLIQDMDFISKRFVDEQARGLHVIEAIALVRLRNRCNEELKRFRESAEGIDPADFD